MSDTICPACGIEMDQIEKTTITRETCASLNVPSANGDDIVDRGKTVWKILFDARNPACDE